MWTDHKRNQYRIQPIGIQAYHTGKEEMKTGFIGCGNMASAMIRGMLGSGVAQREEMMASAKRAQSAIRIRDELGLSAGSNREVAAFADVLFLAVKPKIYAEVINEIKDCVRDDTLVVSMAPGKSLELLQEMFGRQVKLIRIMPNTPAQVGEGMTGVCTGSNVTEEELACVMRLLEAFGKAAVVDEHLMDAVTAVSGSSPAYVFMFIEALADGAVAEGMPRKDAYLFAAQAVLGSAKMVLESGLHPGELKDMVCSPAGTTIEAVASLERDSLRSAVMEAVRVCAKKSRG